jgi:hypothetical protein
MRVEDVKNLVNPENPEILSKLLLELLNSQGV